MALRIQYIVGFFVFMVISCFFLWVEKESKIKQFLTAKTTQNLQKYDAMYEKYHHLADVIYEANINNNEILDIFSHATTKNDLLKNQAREELFKKLQVTYELLNKHNLKQLHFHLPNNESFLRFHRPTKYGDILTEVRDTVSYVNKHKIKVDGFEEGRIFNGYRFVYPLFDRSNRHLGSVEVSFDTIALNLAFYRSFKDETSFLIKKEVVEKKVFKEEQKNYRFSQFEGYLVEEYESEKLKEIHNNKDIYKSFSPMTLKKAQKIDKAESVYDQTIGAVLTFLPIYSSLSREQVALFVIKSEGRYIEDKILNFYFLFASINLLFGLFLIGIYKNHTKKIKLDTIIQGVESGIGVMGIDGTFLEANSSFCALLGYTNRELIGINCIDLSLESDREKSQLGLKEVIKTKTVLKFEKICIRKDLDLIHLDFSLKLLPSGNEILVVMNSLEDKMRLEELNVNLELEIKKRLEEIRLKDIMLLQQSKNAAMGEMIDAIAHQWVTPLSIIRMYSQQGELFLKEDGICDKKGLLEYSKKTQFQIDHLLSTIQEFREFFKIKEATEKADLREIVESVLRLMKDELIHNTIETEIEGEKGVQCILFANEFKHVLINLINNSKDAFNERIIPSEIRKIVFRISCHESYGILEVSDNGGGIPEPVIENIFKPYFTTKKDGKGSGVGLYLVSQIITKINGIIEVKNTGKGAIFTIKIPLEKI